MIKERITRGDIESYKREILKQSVLVGIDEAAKVLACSTRTVRRLISDGKITSYTEGCGTSQIRGTRVLAAELVEYVRSIRVDRFK